MVKRKSKYYALAGTEYRCIYFFQKQLKLGYKNENINQIHMYVMWSVD
jgi:hypothetical protein